MNGLSFSFDRPRLPRRRFLAQAAVTMGACALARGPAFAQPGAADDAATRMPPTARAAVERGLKFLADRQTEEGAFGERGYARNVAICGLGGMAFLSQGSTPGRGPFGQQVQRCVDYILDNTEDSGYIKAPGAVSHGPMYGHGFATLFLAEAYGMSRRGDLREKLTKAVRLIVSSQNHEGGWRYEPGTTEADISVTVSEIMALRAARNAGLYVPTETIDRAVEYVKKCQNPDGGFMYMLPSGESRFPRSAAGIVALYSAGIYEGEEIRKGLEYLMRNSGIVDQVGADGHWFYGQYYAIQAMWHAGGTYWQQWYPRVVRVLLEKQLENGSWFDQICAEYGTAMACLVLQTPSSYLPIFHR